jgi:primary-amine oxidase
MSDDDPPALRASYTKAPYWVTPYDGKRYAAGDYVFMADGTTDGIQNWVQQQRPVADKDVVLWVNVGFSHITHSENWPLMATEWFGQLELEPFNFFSRNPVGDLSDDN